MHCEFAENRCNVKILCLKHRKITMRCVVVPFQFVSAIFFVAIIKNMATVCTQTRLLYFFHLYFGPKIFLLKLTRKMTEVTTTATAVNRNLIPVCVHLGPISIFYIITVPIVPTYQIVLQSALKIY